MGGTKDEDFAAMLAEFEAPQRRGPRPGDTVRGRVVSIGQDAVFIDLGGKAEGTLDAVELRDAETGKLSVGVGDEIEARVASVDDAAGMVVLRRALGRGPDARAELEQAFAHAIPVEGVVTGVNKGGVEVQVAGVRAFCPISQLDARRVEDATPFVGQRLTFRITKFEAPSKGRENVVLSRRVLLEEEARAKGEETRAKLHPGAVLRGTVSSLKDYGAFIDLGGVEGMLHVSEIGFQRVSHPKDALSVGQSVEVQVLKLDGDRISLSLKSLERDPWEDVAERFPEGRRVPGTVARVEPFGAFVEIAPGVEGLVHVSALGAGKRVQHAREVVKPGDRVDVTVLGVDRERRRVSLAIASADDEEAAPPPPAAPQKLGTLGDLLQKSADKKKKR